MKCKCVKCGIIIDVKGINPQNQKCIVCKDNVDLKELAIYKRALELACEKYINVEGLSYVLIDYKGYFGKSDEQIQKETIDYFISQAKKELEEQYEIYC